MGTFTDKIYANKNGYAEQLAQYGIDNNPNMKDFADFKEALVSALSGTTQGQGAVDFLTEEELVELFKQPNVRETISINIGDEEADEIYRVAERTDFVVVRRVPVGRKTRQRDIKTWIVGKPIKAKSYTRKGRVIRSYSRAYNRWTPQQKTFLKQQRTALTQKKTTISQIAFEYNKEFKESPRSTSSVQSRLYRI